MEILIQRIYHTNGTNGTLFINGKQVCYTIELPWHDNKHAVSCIPEGSYIVKKRTSHKFGQHLLVTGVPNRSFILFHPANNALKELKGCIAPVSALTGEGTGLGSKSAFIKLMELVNSKPVETIFLTIKTS